MHAPVLININLHIKLINGIIVVCSLPLNTILREDGAKKTC